MSIYDGHRKRIREKYLKNGINSLFDYEILELLLSYAIPRKDTKELAKELLKKFGSIEKVLNAKKEDLEKINGLGDISISFLKLMGELPNIFYEADRQHRQPVHPLQLLFAVPACPRRPSSWCINLKFK